MALSTTGARDLVGKSIIVTGANSGIGRHAATATLDSDIDSDIDSDLLCMHIQAPYRLSSLQEVVLVSVP